MPYSHWSTTQSTNEFAIAWPLTSCATSWTGHRNATWLLRLRLRGHGHLPQGQGPGSKASKRRHGSHQPSPPTRPRTGAAPDIGQFQNNPMRPDRHWSRAAHVGQRAGQVPAPQLVFGAVGVRRRGVAVTGSSTDGLCVWRPAPGVVRFARRCRGCRYWSLRWCGTAFPVPRRFGRSPSGVDLVASAAL